MQTPRLPLRLDRILTRARAWSLVYLHRTVVLDTETTDLDGLICELSIVDPHGTVLLDTLVRPAASVHPDARAVHGITDEDLQGAPTLAQLWPTLCWILSDDVHIAAYNAPFDRAALARSCAAEGLDPGPITDPARWVCIMRTRSRIEGTRWQRLDAGHRALGDALAAGRVLVDLAHARPTRATTPAGAARPNAIVDRARNGQDRSSLARAAAPQHSL